MVVVVKFIGLGGQTSGFEAGGGAGVVVVSGVGPSDSLPKGADQVRSARVAASVRAISSRRICVGACVRGCVGACLLVCVCVCACECV